MSDYNQYFTQQMAEWAKTRNGPPPVYSPEIAALKQPSKKFNLAEAIHELAKEKPGLALWIYEHWSLKQDVRYKHREEKAEIIKSD
jgi:hypothetical protein